MILTCKKAGQTGYRAGPNGACHVGPGAYKKAVADLEAQKKQRPVVRSLGKNSLKSRGK